jgi:DNA-binding CsgD family transcriptional regulator
VFESKKAILSRQIGGRLHHTLPAQPLHNVERLQTRLHTGPTPEKAADRTAMEHFGRSVAELLECSSCYVAVMPHRAAGSMLEEVRIGHATIDPSCTTAVARIARKGASSDCALLEPVNARNNLVRRLIGPEPKEKTHSVIGRFASSDEATLVFVAGWRPAALVPTEIPCLARAVRAMWETALALAQPASRHIEAPVWLEELVFPAFMVDNDLHIHEINSGGRMLLTKGEFLTADGGRLAGSSDSVTENLRGAVRETLTSRAAQGGLNTTVPLLTERQQFAFAKIGAVPGHCDAGTVLVIVPQFDEVSGANRIAAAFGLNWAEERIIARILQGQCPRHIGAELRLTEATVRTYTKRIMLKLGINRQSEFFLLYHLTQSPFGAGRREKAVGHLASGFRLNGESETGLWTPGRRARD